MCKMVEINCLIKEHEHKALILLLKDALDYSETTAQEEIYWALLDMIEETD